MGLLDARLVEGLIVEGSLDIELGFSLSDVLEGELDELNCTLTGLFVGSVDGELEGLLSGLPDEMVEGSLVGTLVGLLVGSLEE